MKIVKQEKVFSGKFINIVKKDFVAESGKQGIWECVEFVDPKKRGVTIFAITKNREVILEKIFRVPGENYVIELPAGATDGKEADIDAAKRELLEETGYSAKEIIPVFSSVSLPGTVKLGITYFFAPNVEFIGKRGGEDEEEIEIIKVPLDNLVDFIIEQSKTERIENDVLAILPILQNKKLI